MEVGEAERGNVRRRDTQEHDIKSEYTPFYTETLSHTYTVTEDLVNPLILGIIAQDVDLSSQLSDSDDYANLRYSFLSQDHPHTFRFSIDEITSAISTNDRLDRDVICEFTPESCELSLEVAAQSTIGVFFKKIQVTVVIKDQNDHAPSFDHAGMFYLSISESSQIGREFTLDSAKDKDSKRYSVTNYSVVPSTSPFTTKFTIDLVGSTDVKLKVTRELDRETNDHYQLQVIAEDGGSPPKTGVLNINVTIEDENDNPPTFTLQSYNVSVKEDIAIGTVILEMKAVDPDVGKNGEVIYKISTNQRPEIQALFTMDLTSGKLAVAQTLMPAETYKLIVEAYDKGDQPSKAQVYVFIHVEDSGNNPPEIKINLLYGGDQNVAKISEYANMGSPVAHVAVTDPDTGRNGIVTCSISNSEDYFQLQRLEVNEYKVIVHKPLDRENKAQHDISVFCEDVGTPPLNNTKTFSAVVLDENDKYPQFSKPVYTVTFPENRNNGEVIIQVTANDLDEGDNARLSYTLDGDSKGYFSIDNTGRIFSNIAFDRETTPLFKFQVIASDHGDPPLSSTATIELNISDENDNSPEFTETTYTTLIQENMQIDTYVMQVYASDRDADSNGYVTFSLAQNSNVPFLVLPDGSIHTTQSLDREVVNKYVFNVLATDHGIPARESSVQVTVTVGDRNDNTPVIIYPNISNDTVHIPYTSRENTIIAVIQAHDLDLGLNQKLLFLVKERNDSDLFNVLSITGEVIVARQMQESHRGRYFLQIVVMDQGTPYLSSVTKLTIVVTDKNVTATTMPPSDGVNKYNVAIVVTVVVVTLVLSATILVTIFIIRRLDRKKFSEGLVLDGTKPQAEKNLVKSSNLTGKATPNLYSPQGERVGVGMYSYATEPALDRMSLSSNNTLQASHVSYDHTDSGSKEGTLQRCETPQNDVHQSDLHRLASIRLHQALVQSHDKAYANQHVELPYNRETKKSTDDNSDTSGDTIPSDSGRGASDQEEVQSITQSHTSEHLRRQPPPISRNFRNTEKFQRNIPQTNHYMDMSGRKVNNGINSGIIPQRFHEELKHQLQPCYSFPRQQKLSYSSVGSDVPTYGHFQRGLSVDETVDSIATGYDDDDTTTSGSYTIDNDDFPMELHFEKVHDVFV
ncbi:protocadherin gamma-A4-like [Ylistrum balloti]|uniref:protocadherin gamma-A4-like n=1 Tax=Ylistrum balloti TaxID=509963 RepID=UPI002905DD45|nr:protocadherin gamma-A4-like [Ylistrum balloti]